MADIFFVAMLTTIILQFAFILDLKQRIHEVEERLVKYEKTIILLIKTLEVLKGEDRYQESIEDELYRETEDSNI